MHRTNFNNVNSADFEFKFMGKRSINAIYMSVILCKAMRPVIQHKYSTKANGKSEEKKHANWFSIQSTILPLSRASLGTNSEHTASDNSSILYCIRINALIYCMLQSNDTFWLSPMNFWVDIFNGGIKYDEMLLSENKNGKRNGKSMTK